MSTAAIVPPSPVEVTLDERDQKRGLGDFLLSVARASDPIEGREAEEYLRKSYRSTRATLTKVERRALGINSGVVGGFAVPAGFVSRFVEIAGETAIVRPRATVLPMETLEVPVPMLDQVTAQAAGSPPYFGGFLPSWIADAASSPESEPKFRMATLVAHTLSGYFKCGRTLLSNSPALSGGLLERICGDATAWMEDLAFLTGDGVGKPLGVQKSGALITTAARAGAGGITFADSQLLTKAMLPSSRSRAVYLVSQAAEDEALGMTSAADSVFARSTTHLDPATGRARLFLGRNEVLASEKLPALNAAGDYGLFDFSRYLIGDLLTMEVMASEHVDFRNNQVAFRLLHHVAGLPMLSGPVTLPDGTSQASSFAAPRGLTPLAPDIGGLPFSPSIEGTAPMPKTAPREPAILPVRETAAYLEVDARRKDVQAQLREAEADLEARRRLHTENWQELVAAAIAAGTPAPPRPALADIGDASERIDVLRRASTLVMRNLDDAVKAESRRVLDELAPRRAELVGRQAAVLSDLVEATREYLGLRAGLDEAGLHTDLVEWLSPIDLPFLETIAATYARQAPSS